MDRILNEEHIFTILPILLQGKLKNIWHQSVSIFGAILPIFQLNVQPIFLVFRLLYNPIFCFLCHRHKGAVPEVGSIHTCTHIRIIFLYILQKNTKISTYFSKNKEILWFLILWTNSCVGTLNRCSFFVCFKRRINMNGLFFRFNPFNCFILFNSFKVLAQI